MTFRTHGRGAPTGQWQTWLDRVSPDGWLEDRDALQIWGYTGRPSYAPGEDVELHVSTTATMWSYEVWRDGAIFERVHASNELPGAEHIVPDDVVGNGCGWPVEARFTVPDDWPSGGYVVVFRGERDGLEATHDGFFVVRAAEPGAGSKLAVIASTYTWQEYNDWGGGCGYWSATPIDHPADPAEVRRRSFEPRLSFHRPWSRGLIRTPIGAPRLAQQPPPVGSTLGIPAVDWAISNGYSIWTVGAGWARYDALTVRWLEAEGYRPELLSQWDLDRDPTVLDRYRAVVTSGHDEYWTAAGRDVLDGFIAGGGRHARLAGNTVWQARLDDELTLACDNSAADGHEPDVGDRTGAFEARHIDRPPVTTFGANGLRGVYSRIGGLSPRGPGGFIVYRPDHWAFDGADVYYGDVIGGDVPVVGYAADGVDYTINRGLPAATGHDGAPDSLEILAVTPVTLEEEDHGRVDDVLTIADADLAFAAMALFGSDAPEHRDRVRYGSAVITSMPSGDGEVFCAATTEWCHALARRDVQCEIITRNVLDRFLG